MAKTRNMAVLYNMAMLHLLGLARQSPFNCFRRDLAVFNCRWTDPGRPGIQFAVENWEFTERFTFQDFLPARGSPVAKSTLRWQVLTLRLRGRGCRWEALRASD
jgi:hypothetical protein